MKVVFILLITIISYASARPTFDKIAEVLLNVLRDEPRYPNQYSPNHHGAYGQGYQQQYHYGGGEASGYSHGGVIGGYPNNGYYPQSGGNPNAINPAYYNAGYSPEYQSGAYPNANYGPNNGFYGQSPPYAQNGYNSRY